jgi:hypothetical protein
MVSELYSHLCVGIQSSFARGLAQEIALLGLAQAFANILSTSVASDILEVL